MALPFTDSFTRANAGTLGSNWQNSDSSWSIVSNRAEAQTAGSWIRTDTAAYADTADIKVEVRHASTAPDGGPLSRVTTIYPANPFGFALYMGTNTYSFVRHTGGSELQIASGSVSTLATGLAGQQVVGSGTVAYKLFYQSVQIVDDTDTGAGAPHTSTGRSGLVNWKTAGINSSFTDFAVTAASGGATNLPITLTGPGGGFAGRSRGWAA